MACGEPHRLVQFIPPGEEAAGGIDGTSADRGVNTMLNVVNTMAWSLFLGTVASITMVLVIMVIGVITGILQ